MINESFEEQQRQYKLYFGDKLKSAFYSAPDESFYGSPVEQEPPTVYPIPVPENDEPLYTNDSLYSHWKEESPPLRSAYDSITKPIVSDIFNNIMPCMDEDDDSEMKSAMTSLHPSIPESMDSLKLYNNDISPPAPSFNSADDPYIDPSYYVEDDDAMATVLSSANFVLEERDSPQMVEYESRTTSSLCMKLPTALRTPPTMMPDSDDSEDEEELVSAWKENMHSDTTGDNVRVSFPPIHYNNN